MNRLCGWRSFDWNQSWILGSCTEILSNKKREGLQIFLTSLLVFVFYLPGMFTSLDKSLAMPVVVRNTYS